MKLFIGIALALYLGVLGWMVNGHIQRGPAVVPVGQPVMSAPMPKPANRYYEIQLEPGHSISIYSDSLEGAKAELRRQNEQKRKVAAWRL